MNSTSWLPPVIPKPTQTINVNHSQDSRIPESTSAKPKSIASKESNFVVSQPLAWSAPQASTERRHTFRTYGSGISTEDRKELRREAIQALKLKRSTPLTQTFQALLSLLS